MSNPFQTALTAAQSAAADLPIDDENALAQALYAMRKNWPGDPTADDVRAAFSVCHAVLAHPGSARLSYAVMEMIKRLVADPEGRYRDHVRHSFNHHRAFGRERPYGRFEAPIPAAYLPITVAEARTLIQPLLSQYEGRMDADPITPLRLAWDVLEFPIAPFDQVFDAWLQEVEAKGLGYGDSHTGLSRAMAFYALAEEGRQRVTRASVDDQILPVLDDPNPVLAAAAARFLGRVHEDVEEFYNNGTPWPLPDLLDHLAARPAATRRALAGGFLNGFADVDEPFAMLQSDPRIGDFNLEAWAMRILGGSAEEVYIPCAQAFWFYVHEAFDRDAAFMTRLIDAGHTWEAMMCATEIRDRVEGVAPILGRLAQLGEKGVSEPAEAHLRRFYSDA